MTPVYRKSSSNTLLLRVFSLGCHCNWLRIPLHARDIVTRMSAKMTQAFGVLPRITMTRNWASECLVPFCWIQYALRGGRGITS